MKARILFVTLMVAFTSFATAQETKKCNNPTPEQRTEQHVKRMQQKLMLDEAAAAEFAPIYKEYLQAKAACRPACVRGKELTDAQIKSNIEARMEARQKTLDVDKKYYGKLSKVLNAKQLNIIFAQKQFPAQGNWKKGGKYGKRAACPQAPACKKDRKKVCAKRVDCMNGCKKADSPKKADCKNACPKKADCLKAESKK